MKILRILVITLLLFIHGSALAHGHDLIPTDVLNLIQSNPDITTDELDRYLDQSPPSAAGDTAKFILETKAPDMTFLTMIALYITLGLEHILSGADHVLFVLSLLLVFERLWVTIELFTAFTIAHSTTLILVTLGAFSLTSAIVEPIIALSIAFVAISSVFFRQVKWLASDRAKIAVVFFFGLFHGLGFAGVLQEFQFPEGQFFASLISFNVGIEIGQLIILAFLLPSLFLFRKERWYPVVVQVVAIVISVLAMVWFLQRVFAFEILPAWFS